jgi:hypothetical protein
MLPLSIHLLSHWSISLMTDFQAPEEVNSYSKRAMLAFYISILNPGPLTQLRL